MIVARQQSIVHSNGFAKSVPWVFCGTDGAGGAHPKCSICRRCGWGAVELAAPFGWDSEEGVYISWACWGPLPPKQTVYRAELYALLMLVRKSNDTNLFVVVDNLAIVSQWAHGNVDFSSHKDGDLWSDFWSIVKKKEITVFFYSG